MKKTIVLLLFVLVFIVLKWDREIDPGLMYRLDKFITDKHMLDSIKHISMGKLTEKDFSIYYALDDYVEFNVLGIIDFNENESIYFGMNPRTNSIVLMNQKAELIYSRIQGRKGSVSFADLESCIKDLKENSYAKN